MTHLTLEDGESNATDDGAEMDIKNRQHCEDEVYELQQQNRELRAKFAKWMRRALAFQEGYKEKSFQVTMQEIQILDLQAYGVDKVTARQNASLKAKLLAACIERNELRELASLLITNAEMIPDPRREGATDCYAVTLDDLEALQTALVDGPTKEQETK